MPLQGFSRGSRWDLRGEAGWPEKMYRQGRYSQIWGCWGHEGGLNPVPIGPDFHKLCDPGQFTSHLSGGDEVVVLEIKEVMLIKLVLKVKETKDAYTPPSDTYSFGSGKTSPRTMMTCPGQRPRGRAREQGTS